MLVCLRLYFFPRVVLYNFFSFLLIYGGLGVGVLGVGSYFGFLKNSKHRLLLFAQAKFYNP